MSWFIALVFIFVLFFIYVFKEKNKYKTPSKDDISDILKQYADVGSASAHEKDQVSTSTHDQKVNSSNVENSHVPNASSDNSPELDDAESISSGGSIDDLEDKEIVVNVRTWYELSDKDKTDEICRVCKMPVSTITIPCDHPYMCKNCAADLILFHKLCCKCNSKITGYKVIDS